LKTRALTTARLLVEVKKIDRRLMKKIDQKTFTELYAEKVLMFDEDDNLVYASIDAKTIYYNAEFLAEVWKKGYVQTNLEGNDLIGTKFKDEKGKDFVVNAVRKHKNLAHHCFVSRFFLDNPTRNYFCRAIASSHCCNESRN
jgi:hypothetical protein